jgi:hypothetical protein
LQLVTFVKGGSKGILGVAGLEEVEPPGGILLRTCIELTEGVLYQVSRHGRQAKTSTIALS